ncbi:MULTISPECIES: DUF1707 domain-containing protein [unclassified Micromonospora]|uniref:DUF1707 SHOCT-like domain-containing protein n=1 Tax=unclassified Micromonospora TaxID=2617518 RepID=UPI001C22FAA5|nr:MULTISPECIES: DUF1707 domain-containing protein [unclassified Micromonospora]MBU8857110.1 DUF1707 domain-containing protein [Micromonospora sp. WMMB482]MDM4782731.1 DUF1707 domain-containing protein [Micromonospora sp. b486]
MRAADADREATAERLRTALAEGRLDLDEYDDRLRRAYGSKTYGELDELLTDLPGTAPAERSLPAPRATGESGAAARGQSAVSARNAWLLGVWGPWLKVALILTSIWFVSQLGEGEFEVDDYWPIWVLGPWGAVVLYQTIQGLAAGAPEKDAERRRRKQVEREARRRAKRELPET